MPFIGTIAIAKAIAGGDFLIRAAFMASYLYSTHEDDRDEIGMAVGHKRVRPMAMLAGTFALVLGFAFLIAVQQSAWKMFLFMTLIFGFGTYWVRSRKNLATHDHFDSDCAALLGVLCEFFVFIAW